MIEEIIGNQNKQYVNNELEIEIEKVLEKYRLQKCFSFKHKNKDKNSYSNYIKNSSVYSKTNNELYILLTSIKKDLEIYHLITFSINTSSLKSAKEIIFTIDEEIKECNKSILINDFYLHEANQNQMCFFNEEYIGFIKDLKSSTRTIENIKTDNDFIKIKIIHTSKLKNDKNINDSHSFKYKKFKFSNFDNYFGVIFTNNSFRLYNIDSKVSECVINKIAKDVDIVDFSFGAVFEFSWLNFSIFFIDENGGIYYVCPIFHDDIKITKTYLKNIEIYTKNCKLYDSKKELHDDYYLNENLIKNILKSAISYKANDLDNIDSYKDLQTLNDENLILRSSEYLKNFNINPIVSNLLTIDKRKNTDSLLIKNNSIFFNIFVMKIYPLTIFRIGYKTGSHGLYLFIDVLICNNDILPLRNNQNIPIFLVETILFKYDIPNLSNNISNIQNVFKLLGGEHDLNDGRNYYKICKNCSIYVNILNDIFQINFPYLKIISDFFNIYDFKKDLALNFVSTLTNIVKFQYSKNDKISDKFMYGYIASEKLSNSFIIITCSKSKIYVKELKCEKSNEINIVKSNNDLVLKLIKYNTDITSLNKLDVTSIKNLNNRPIIQNNYENDYFSLGNLTDEM